MGGIDAIKADGARRFLWSTMAVGEIGVGYDSDFSFDGGGDDVDGDREEGGGGAV